MMQFFAVKRTEQQLQQLTEKLEKTADGYGMEISYNKSKFLVNSIKTRPSIILMNGKTLEEVDQLKYPGLTQTKDGTSIKVVKIRLAQAYSAMTS